VERFKRGFTCVGKLDRREGDMIETEFLRVDGRTKADNIAFVDQSFQPCLARCLGKTDLFREFCDGNTSVFAQHFQNTPIELVQIVYRIYLSHSFSLLWSL